MNDTSLLRNPAEVQALADRLANVPGVMRDNHDQNQVLAHSLSGLEDSFRRFLTDQLPKLVEGSLSPDQIDLLLIEIGEEFRHIVYHITESAYYQYLWPFENSSQQD